MVKEKKIKLIDELRELKDKKNVTYQDIAEKTAENGEPVSLSTVKKVFSDKYNHDHDYTHVLKPIANVLMPPSVNDTLEVKILQTRLDLKDERIKELEERLEKKEYSYKERESFYKEQIEYFRNQTQNRDGHINNRDEHIKNLDDHIRHLNQAVERKDALIKALYEQLMNKEIKPFTTDETR